MVSLNISRNRNREFSPSHCRDSRVIGTGYRTTLIVLFLPYTIFTHYCGSFLAPLCMLIKIEVDCPRSIRLLSVTKSVGRRCITYFRNLHVFDQWHHLAGWSVQEHVVTHVAFCQVCRKSDAILYISSTECA